MKGFQPEKVAHHNKSAIMVDKVWFVDTKLLSLTKEERKAIFGDESFSLFFLSLGVILV